MAERRIPELIQLISDKFHAEADEKFSQYGITGSQIKLLIQLIENGNEMTQRELELKMDVSHPTVVGLVNRLEQNGFLKCCICTSDKRNKIVRTTDKALEVAKNIRDGYFEHERKMLDGFDNEEIKILHNMLTRLYKNV
ncbi:DNA-binding transcriptional regulator, MarR family [Lachnospiraceae bacterium KH1T2]|nr:DNA-binding transcriptional regulator, MarR family [Lachnospiraceae bacterium KH1T2]